MFRSPPQLRSGSKGEPVRLDQDSDKKIDKKHQRSLSVSESTCRSTMAPADKNFDNDAITAAVNKCLAKDDVIGHLVTRMSAALKIVVEEAVKTALSSFTAEMDRLRGEVTSLAEKVKELDDRLGDRTDELEQYQRRNNLRVFGVEEVSGENTDLIVRELCREQLGVDLPPSAICRSHRVGRQPQPGPDGKQRARPIIVRFTSYQVRREVYGAKKRLKGSGVTVREDLTARRMEVLRRATATHGVRSTWSQDGRVLWIDKNGKKGVATRLADLAHP